MGSAFSRSRQNGLFCRELNTGAMRKELEQELVERWPWFNVNGDIHHTLMTFGFAHGDGWFAIVRAKVVQS